MAADRKDREWLKDQLVTLFQDAAAGGEKPEHPVCVKYAELLYKLLEPSSAPKAGSGDLEAIRRAVLEIDDEEAS